MSVNKVCDACGESQHEDEFEAKICNGCASKIRESAPFASTIIARDAIALLREVFYARLPLGTRVDDAICEVDTSIYDRVHSFLAAQQAPVA